MIACRLLFTPPSLAALQASSLDSVAQVDYDEFAYFHENAEEWNLPFTGPPAVTRVSASVSDNRKLSGLAWGDQPSSVVLLHGGAQNAHTYDTVALAMGCSLLALDLPGHGHSDGPDGGMFDPEHMATDVANTIRQLADAPVVLVGMSLGGLVSIFLASRFPELVAKVAFIDITPGVNKEKAGHITAFINGPQGFESFDDLLERTKAFNPTRSESSLRRGILHNAVQTDDGTWVWRWAQHRSTPIAAAPRAENLWDVLGSLTQPSLLIRGMDEGSVVDDADQSEFSRRLPHSQVVQVPGAGHSVQGDQPIVLSQILSDFIAES
jgi:pimeloyl-ACP methyl ester carboxylesterase